MLDPQILDRPQRSACRAADVVGAGLETVELLDDGQRDHDGGVAERHEAVRIGDQHGRVDDTTGAAAGASMRSGRPAWAMSLRAPSPAMRSVTVTSDVCDRPGEPGWRRTEPSTRIVVPQSRPTVVDAVPTCVRPGPRYVLRSSGCLPAASSAMSSPGASPPSRSSVTTSRWRSSTSRRCSPGTPRSFPCGMSRRSPTSRSTKSVRTSNACRRSRRRVPEAFGAAGTFVANNNVVSQSVPHLHVHVVPRTRGDGLRGFFWPRRRYAEAKQMRMPSVAPCARCARAEPETQPVANATTPFVASM